MDWDLVSNIVAGGLPLIALNSFINKLVLDNAINKTLLILPGSKEQKRISIVEDSVILYPPLFSA